MTVEPDDWTTFVRALVAESPGDLAGPVNRDRCWDYIRMVRDSWHEATKRAERTLILMILLLAFFELIRSAQVEELQLLGVRVQNPNILARGVTITFAALYASVARNYVTIEVCRYILRLLQMLMGVPGAGAMQLIHLNPSPSLLYVDNPSAPALPPMRSVRYAIRTFGRHVAGDAIQVAGVVFIVIVGPAAAIGWMVWQLWPQGSEGDSWLYLTFLVVGLLFLVAVKDYYAGWWQRPWYHRVKALLEHESEQ